MLLPQTVVAVVGVGLIHHVPRKLLVILPSLGSAFVAASIVVVVGIGSRKSPFLFIVVPERLSVVAIVVVGLSMVDLVMATISSEATYALVPELFMPKHRVVGTAIVNALQVFPVPSAIYSCRM